MGATYTKIVILDNKRAVICTKNYSFNQSKSNLGSRRLIESRDRANSSVKPEKEDLQSPGLTNIGLRTLHNVTPSKLSHIIRHHGELIIHAFLCLIFIAGMIYLWLVDWSKGDAELIVNNVFVAIGMVGIFYLNVFWLIPAFLKKRTWLDYGLLLVACFLLMEILRAITHTLIETSPDLSVLSLFLYSIRHDEILSGPVTLSLILSYAYSFTRDWMINLRLIEQLKADKNAMELAFLRSQVDPHFLFNTLNSIYALALNEESPDTADSIAMLGTLMRYNLHDSLADDIPLDQELDYIQKYIALQKLRLTANNTLKLSIDTEATLANPVRIAPMLLIPIIENAFKYGTSSTEATFIHISIQQNGHSFSMQVENSVPQLILATTESNGVGLSNLTQRLALLYPDKHRFSHDLVENTYSAHLDIQLSP